MKAYKDINGDSGIVAYEYGNDYIRVQFKSGSPYIYSYNSAGKQHIEEMKKLADSGDGLNAYINHNVKYDYVR